jgi:hypothetical protein
VRRIPAVALVAAALYVVLLPLACLGLWARREVVSTSAFDHLADRVLEQRPVRREVTAAVVSELGSEVPELTGQDRVLSPIVTHVVSAAQVRSALTHSLSHTHAQLRDGHDPLQLDLNPVLPVVRHQLPESLAEEIPADTRLDTVTVLHRRDAPLIWSSVEFVQGFALVVALGTVALLIVAILTARRRGTMCVVLGAITTLVSLVLIALVERGRTLLEHGAGGSIRLDALRAGYYTVVHSFATQMIVVATAGVLVGVVGLVLAHGDRPTTRAPANRKPAVATRT